MVSMLRFIQLYKGQHDYIITWGNQSASNVYTHLHDGYDIYQVNAFGRTNYVAAIGTLGEMYQSSDRAIGFSGMFVGSFIGSGGSNLGFGWINSTNEVLSTLSDGADTMNDARMFLEMTYFNELRLDRARSGNFSNPINHKLRPIKNVGKVLNRAGGALIGADILMSGEIKPSHAINALMIGISGTGVGALIGGVWFLADFGTMGVNWALGNGAIGLGDMIDNTLGTYEMYEGLY